MGRACALALLAALCRTVCAVHLSQAEDWESSDNGLDMGGLAQDWEQASNDDLDTGGDTNMASSLSIVDWLHSTLQEGPSEELVLPAPTGPKLRVAVLTGGTLVRYFLNSTAKGLIAPLVQEGHTVDYYLSLNLEGFSSWKYYAEDFSVDPSMAGKESDKEFLTNLVNGMISAAGGTVRQCELNTRVVLSGDAVEQFGRRATGWNSGMRNATRSTSARSNVLKLMKTVEDLWHRVLEVEATHGRYDFVITLKDDSFWVKPFSLNRLLQSHESMGGNVPGAQVYNQKCSEWDGSAYDAEKEGGFTEYILILKRDIAEPLTAMYSRLMENERFWSEHNLESFVKRTADEQKIVFAHMPASLIPMQRCGRIRVGRSVVTCLHKACDSATLKVPLLRPYFKYPKCSDVFMLNRLVRPPGGTPPSR